MTDFLLLAFIFLVAGVIAVPVASRLRLGSVLGYLLAGIAISPALNLLHVDVVSIQHFAEFGVVMMLFLVGLELDPSLLWKMRTRLLGLGGLQVLLTVILVTGVAIALGQAWSVALAIGMVFSLSSTAIVLQTLNERGLMKSDGGQSSFSVLLFQDVAVIPMLALMPLLAIPQLQGASIAGTTELEVITDLGTETAHAAINLNLVANLPGWQAALATIVAIFSVVLAGSRLIGPLFHFVAMAHLRELFTATALLIVIGIALLMSLVGVSPALGTFLAGVVLANSEYRHELESDIDPFRGLLLGLFFMTVGAGINFGMLTDNVAMFASLTLGLITLKAAVLLLVAKLFGLQGADRWLFSLGLAQAGEFGFVLLAFAVGIAVVPAALADQLLVVVALSMLLTPALFLFFDRVVASRYSDGKKQPADSIDSRASVVIAGHGRVGGIANRLLRSAGYETTVIDYSSEQLKMLRTFGVRVYFGDATRPDLLHTAGLDSADLLVVAIDDRDQIDSIVKYALKHFPKLHVTARAVNRHHVYDLWALGCRDIIRDTFDSSLRIGRSALEALGMSNDEAMQHTRDFESSDRQMMLEMAQLYNPDIPPHENQNYVLKMREFNAQWENQCKAKRDAVGAQGRTSTGQQPDDNDCF